MIAKADVDASGYIDFDEFLMILKIGDKNDAMSKFFKDMVNGDLPGLSSYGDMPFRLMVSTFRRKQMMSAMFSADPNEKQKGERVMTAYSKQIGTNRGGTSRSMAYEEEEQKIGFPKFPRIIDAPTNRRPKTTAALTTAARRRRSRRP